MALGTYKGIDINEGSQEQINQQVRDIDAGLSTGSLAPQAPYSIPETPKPNLPSQYVNESSVISKLTREKDKAASAETKSESEYASLFNEALGISQSKTGLEESAGLPKYRTDLADVQNQIDAKQQSILTTIDKLKESNAYGEGLDQKIAEVERQGARDLASLRIQESALVRNMTALQSNIDRKIELELEPLKLRLDFVKDFVKRNQDRFDKSEDRLFQSIIKQEDRAYEDAKIERERVGQIQANVAANGAPTSVMQAVGRAETLSDALEAAGSWYNLLDRKQAEAQITKLNQENLDNNLPTVQNDNASKYASALTIILGSGKFTKDQKRSVINAVNSGEDPFTVIKNQAKGLMAAENANKVQDYEVAKQAMADLQTNLNAFYQQGGQTGLLQGNYERVLNNLGQVQDPKLVSIAVQIAANLQAYRNAVSGTAYSVQEGKDIAFIFPGINKSQGLNDAVISGRMLAFDSNIDAAYQSVLGSTYTTLKNIDNDPMGLVPISTQNPAGI